MVKPRFLFFLGLLLTKFALANDTSALDNVFGQDDRQPMLSAEYPWSTIGRLSTNCTGTLVAANLVLTAAHCVIDPVTKKLKTDLTHFNLNMVAGRSLVTVPIDKVWWGTTHPDENRAQDWALCRIVLPIGDRYGWMGVVDTPDVRAVHFAGYSDDYEKGLTATAHVDCSVHGWESKGLVLHACDMRQGASGGPLFRLVNGAAQLVALNVAERRNGEKNSLTVPAYAPEVANLAVPATAFLPTLQEILNKP